MSGGRPWTEADDIFLKENYADNSNINIAKVLERTKGSVFLRARTLGLKKSHEFMSANIHKAQSKSVTNNRKSKEYHLEHERELKRKRRAYLKEHEPEKYAEMLRKHRERNKKYYYKKK